MADRTRVGSLLILPALALALTSCTSSTQSRQASDAPSTSTTTHDPRSATSHNFAATPTGRLITRTIPGGSTGFAPRPAVIYLPPAAQTHPSERFPVLLLLHGTKGGPTNWDTSGRAAEALNRFAATHGGKAPVVLMPDINGSLHDDTECIRTTRGGNVERYLLDVVPAWIRTHLPVSASARSWGVEGASEGGTCAMVLALRASRTFSFVGDFSGLRRPTVGDTDDPAATIARLFGGSRTAYDAHDPTVLLRRHRYPRLSAWLECGASDTAVVADQRAVGALARRSLHAVHTSTTPGRHSWSVWRTAFASALPRFWARGGA
ncbi:alpha/beta hydrolase [uncultured Jatrophihabitans sp.]|uniref:alpha/beta hydrolase n=1 Tax=uncultured Jatrophihabitans sp. TaxID=1610747 RepID=UPI0035CB6932